MNIMNMFGVSILIAWLGCLLLMFVRLNNGFRTQIYYCSNELYYATKALSQWMDEGKIESHHHLEITSHLVKLVGRNADDGFARLKLIAGPNGWTVYQALLAKRNLWKRLFIRTWNR